MEEPDVPSRNGKQKRSLSESDVDPESQAATTDSLSLKKSMFREQRKLFECTRSNRQWCIDRDKLGMYLR